MTHRKENAVRLLKLLCCHASLAEAREGKERGAKHVTESRAMGEYSGWLMQPVGGTAQQLCISPGLISEKQH